MDRRQLEYFLAVASHGSFTSAASALRVAQPSLSYTIRTLERELGTSLFHRLGRGVRLTPEGQALVGSAQQVLRAFQSALSSVQQVTRLEAGRLDIVALTTLAVDPLAGLVGTFRRAHPGVDIRIEDPEHAAAVAEMVRVGECELGLADFSVPSAGLRALELREQEMLAVLPPDAEMATGRSVKMTQVAAMDLITTPPGTTTRTLLEQSLAGAGVPLRIAVETPHRAAIVPLVLAGAGVALLPRPMAEDAARQGARIGVIDPPVVRRVRLLWRPEPLSHAGQAFVEMVRRETAPGRVDEPSHGHRETL
ncbi:DNA-binding transcriptional LysR family regulator [Nonomuraea polychroma]|uniref:DNA-binding transcriptional LysR family regulator n=1 Tax=Nonomuraea polychroma TaxID=46176 RepID=A0A438M031_9ACTN|nr:LysR family transcriptional regulator [Nonomuraea polychroma]RVX38967.1 DNA-binding transcriptional LysR family regulator [Nonomuraea polychroma]